MKLGIVGAGLIGKKRVESIRSASQGDEVVLICDREFAKAEDLSKECGGKPCQNWRDVVASEEVQAVVVATPNKFLAPISVAALNRGKHVLCEKPLGRNRIESEKIVRAALTSGSVLKTGFNHRYHPALSRAKKLADRGDIGRLLFLRCRYGHGGREGYDREWRADKILSGGGELLDQGVHVVDLLRWFGGDFDEVFGVIRTCYWDMKVEDNAFALFKRKDGLVASMHTSWTQWKNLFSFEIFGTKGYLIINGLGGSYGLETLTVGKKIGEGKPPDEEVMEFPGPDISWEEEWREFLSAIREKRAPLGSGYDGLQANTMIDAVYRSARKNRPVKIDRE